MTEQGLIVLVDFALVDNRATHVDAMWNGMGLGLSFFEPFHKESRQLQSSGTHGRAFSHGAS